MIHLRDGVAKGSARHWQLPDRTFFAAGACHVLAAAVLRRWGGEAVWFRPDGPWAGNHIVVRIGGNAVDYLGLVPMTARLSHHARAGRRRWDAFRFTPVVLDPDDLTGGSPSRRHPGLHLRAAHQFLHDPGPRAETFLDRLTAPQFRGTSP